MKKASYIDCESLGVEVEGACLIVDRYTLYVKMMSPYEVAKVIDIDLDKQYLTETEEGEDELFDYASSVLAEMYRTIKLIERESNMFKRLYVNFGDMVGRQRVRFYKRVFHSQTEKHYFIKNIDEEISKSYLQLFDKYITSTDIDILDLRKTLTPQYLRQIMKKVFFMG